MSLEPSCICPCHGPAGDEVSHEQACCDFSGVPWEAMDEALGLAVSDMQNRISWPSTEEVIDKQERI